IYTYPLAAQVQAAFGDKENAKALSYRAQRTHELLNCLFTDKSQIPVFTDYIEGTNYLKAVLDGKISDDDIVIMSSLNGAQLIDSQQSDMTIYIWIILNYSPDKSYKKKCVLIGGIIPGPNKSSNLESFLFSGFHHLSALQREGLPIWN
ncbi:hypothetical protein CONPUDRAFT_18455, partial [Coniophora puteana RWD-64-598 SS2]